MAFVSMGENDDDAPMSDINVTPLVDVMLVLMIVFMITMPVLTHSIQINLPTTNNAQSQNTPKQETKPIDVAVQVSGKYVLGADSTQQLDLQEVKQKLKTENLINQNKKIVLFFALAPLSGVSFPTLFFFSQIASEPGYSLQI